MSDLHNQIMNLPLMGGWRENLDSFEELAYKIGHRDARHAAAELAMAADARIRQLEEALKETAQSLAWLAFGECRGFSERLLTSKNALEMARAALNPKDPS